MSLGRVKNGVDRGLAASWKSYNEGSWAVGELPRPSEYDIGNDDRGYVDEASRRGNDR